MGPSSHAGNLDDRAVMMISKIISGGQTGVDRAALDVARAMGIPHGGWVPRGRRAEDGIIPAKYQMKEMPTESYAERTEQNVIDSDGTLIISRATLTGGTQLTRSLANAWANPARGRYGSALGSV